MAGLQITFSIVGTLALLFGAGTTAWRLSMLLGWKRRPATVTAYQHQRVRRGSAYSRVTVRLTTGDGEIVEAEDAGVWNRYAEDQAVTVLVVPNSDPVRVVVPEFLRFWMMSLIFVPFGAVFLYVALVYVPSLG
jgi:Protein of unknown function (DUF3592)